MIRVNVLYPNAEGASFDIDYYCSRHMPRVQEFLSDRLKGLGADLGISSPGSPAPYIAVGYLMFDTVEDFQWALQTHGPALLADIPNYTNTRPVFQIGEIKM